MLIELAIGDAYGAGFEYASPHVVERHNDLSRYFQHPRHTLQPGAYTDDTQMSLAIAEAMVSGDRCTLVMLASRFVDAFQRDPRQGYAAAFHQFLLTVRDGKNFLARIRPDSDKSAAAMRAPPIGVFPSLEEVIEKCCI
jgi:ADP-ribosyl-[dinitrogen reductase] hydrolase